MSGQAPVEMGSPYWTLLRYHIMRKFSATPLFHVPRVENALSSAKGMAAVQEKRTQGTLLCEEESQEEKNKKFSRVASQ